MLLVCYIQSFELLTVCKFSTTSFWTQLFVVRTQYTKLSIYCLHRRDYLESVKQFQSLSVRMVLTNMIIPWDYSTHSFKSLVCPDTTTSLRRLLLRLQKLLLRPKKLPPQELTISIIQEAAPQEVTTSTTEEAATPKRTISTIEEATTQEVTTSATNETTTHYRRSYDSRNRS